MHACPYPSTNVDKTLALWQSNHFLLYPDVSLLLWSLDSECPSFIHCLSMPWYVPPSVSSMVCTSCSAYFFPCISAPRDSEVTCCNVFLPLRSPEVSPLHSATFFPCPDRSLLLRAPSCQCPLVAFNARLLTLSQWRVDLMPGLAMRWHFAPPCSAIRPRPQRLGCCNGGFISPATRSDTGSILGYGKCSAHNWQHPPPHLCISMPRGLTSLHPCWYHNCVRKPERSMGYRCVGSLPSSGLSNKPSKGLHPHNSAMYGLCIRKSPCAILPMHL